MSRAAAAAALLADLRLRENGILPPLDDLPEAIRPRSVAEAYETQALLRARLAPRLGAPVGWKIGCTSKVMQEYLGVDRPCLGTLYADGLRRDRATLRAAGYRRLGLECEIAVRLGADLPPGGSARAAVAAVMCSVEIVEERFADFHACATETLIADDFFSAGCVLGAEADPAALPDLRTLEGGFVENGAPGPRGRGEAILGDPLAALAWAAEAAGGLRAGEVVTLGSVVRTIYPEPGARIVAAFGGLAPVTVEVI